MTATNVERAAGQVALPPRPLVRTFWSLHKAAYRLTRGRFGLQEPVRGEKFGMLRLQTVGRQSAQRRIAMIGYFPDGENLVTVAMNGWGKSDPAWWLNLQAKPTATVDTASGTREVRARVASGAEREQLWAAVSEYPGWGADLGALSAQRPTETAIVVLEPAGGATVSRPAAGEGTVVPEGTVAPERAGRRLRRRHLWLIPGLAIAIYANTLGQANGVGILWLIAFGIAPDVPRLFGLRGRPIHNLLHHPLGPIVAVAIAATGVVSTFWLVGALIWLGHIVAGRGLNDVPRPVAERSHA